MSPLVAAITGTATTITTIGGFLLAHKSAIKSYIDTAIKEYNMIRPEIAAFIAAVEKFEAAVTARLAQPAVLTPEETAALADAQAKVDAATAAVGTP